MDATSETKLLKALAVFVPDLEPLIPAIVKAIGTAEEVETILQPAFTRMLQREAAFLEVADAAPAIVERLPDISAAISTLAKLRVIAVKYQVEIDKQIS